MSRKTLDRETRNQKRSQKRSRCQQKRQRQKSRKAKRRNSRDLMQSLSWLHKITFNGVFHDSIQWRPMDVCMQALIWCWQSAKNVTDAFDVAMEQCDKLGISKKVSQSYTSMMNTLTRYQTLLDSTLHQYHQVAQEHAGEHWRCLGWVLFGVDGSRITTPRTESNEQAFCAKNYGHGKTAKYGKKKSQGLRRKKNKEHQKKTIPQEPQLFLTLIWHMQLRLPWIWKAGRSSSSERCDATELLENHSFPEKTLVCGDAGFVGYEFWKKLMDQGLHFLVRVGGNVNLLSDEVDVEKKQGGLVLCWPKNFRGKQPPLCLRLVRVTVGKTDMWMLTSVLDTNELTDDQIVKVYKMRWLIEVEFRGLKQTLDRVKLKCRNSERVYVELNWSLLAMGVAELMATQQQIKKSEREPDALPDYAPKFRSLARTIKAIRYCLRNLTNWVKPQASLFDRLEAAIVQKYKNTSDKRARHRHKNPDKKPLGDPVVQPIDKQLSQKLEKFTPLQAA